jgi:hypothetical protein
VTGGVALLSRRARAEALEQIHEAGVVADQDAGLVPLDASAHAQGGILRRGLRRVLGSWRRRRESQTWISPSVRKAGTMIYIFSEWN